MEEEGMRVQFESICWRGEACPKEGSFDSESCNVHREEDSSLSRSKKELIPSSSKKDCKTREHQGSS